MKKIAAVILSVLMIFCMAGCLEDYGTTSFGSADNSSQNDVVVSVFTSSQDYFENVSSSSVQETSSADTASNAQTSSATIVTSSKVESTSSKDTSSTESKSSQSSVTSTSSEPVNTDALVWVPTNGGKKYHSKSSCSNMKNPRQVTKQTAINEGFGPCGRCY